MRKSFEPTYEELKPSHGFPDEHIAYASFEPTYEELKHGLGTNKKTRIGKF